MRISKIQLRPCVAFPTQSTGMRPYSKRQKQLKFDYSAIFIKK